VSTQGNLTVEAEAHWPPVFAIRLVAGLVPLLPRSYAPDAVMWFPWVAVTLGPGRIWHQIERRTVLTLLRCCSA
jgi:hypothetical protein